MTASYCGHNDVVELLLKENASVNVQQKVCALYDMEEQIVSVCYRSDVHGCCLP